MVAEPVPFNPSIGVHVSAADPLTKAGIVSQLRSAQGFVVSSGDTPHDDGVALVVADDVTDAVTTEIRSLRARGISRVVLLVTWVSTQGVWRRHRLPRCGNMVPKCQWLQRSGRTRMFRR